jgi:hypothetical protein
LSPMANACKINVHISTRPLDCRAWNLYPYVCLNILSLKLQVKNGGLEN